MKLFRFLPFLGLLLLPMPAAAQLSNNLLSASPCAYVDCVVNSLAVNGNAILTGPAAAQLQLGTADVANPPVAQTLSVQSASGISNTNGANTTIDLSAGTGTGTGGNLVINGAPHRTTGSSKNAYLPALTINGDTLLVTANSAFQAAASITLGGSSPLVFAGRSIETSPADGQFKITNNAGSSLLFDWGVIASGKMTFNPTNYNSCTALTTNASGTIGCTTSDMRLKSHISDITPSQGLSAILALPDPHLYRYKDGYGPGGVHAGFFAQDIQQAGENFLVSKGPSTSLTPNGTLRYDQTEQVAYLVAAVKELAKNKATLSHEACLARLCIGWK